MRSVISIKCHIRWEDNPRKGNKYSDVGTDGNVRAGRTSTSWRSSSTAPLLVLRLSSFSASSDSGLGPRPGDGRRFWAASLSLPPVGICPQDPAA